MLNSLNKIIEIASKGYHVVIITRNYILVISLTRINFLKKIKRTNINGIDEL